MPEDRDQRTEVSGRVVWRREPRVAMENGVMDRLVGPLFSVLCSVEIVKRVVTVKQVRPSPLVIVELGRGRAWSMGMRAAGARASAGAAVCATVPKNRFRRHRDQQEARTCGILVCPLISVLCSLHAASPRAWGWARAQHMKGIWWMPWYREAMKDVARCEKPRGGASAR
jgi:hypothetical protein